MHILLHNNIFKKHFAAPRSLEKNEEAVLIYNIMNNSLAKIIVTPQIIDRHYIATLPRKEQNPRKAELSLLYRSGKLVRKQTTALESNEQFIELHTTCNYPCLISIADEDIEIEGTPISIAYPDIAIFNTANFQKPNKHWQRISLAANNTFTVRYLDFQNQTEINQFFTEIFKLPRAINEVKIIDRYMQNVTEHNNFDELKNRNIPIHYYTLNIPAKLSGGRNPLPNLLTDIQDIFNPSTVSFFHTFNKDLIHERKVLFENFILETDEDFPRIKNSIKTWKIDITYNPSLTESILAKLNIGENINTAFVHYP